MAEGVLITGDGKRELNPAMIVAYSRAILVLENVYGGVFIG